MSSHPSFSRLANLGKWGKWSPLIVAGVLILALVGLIVAGLYAIDLPRRVDQQETVLLGQTRFSPGSTAALRVLVRGTQSGQPVSDAAVRLSLQSEKGERVALFEGVTDAGGTANVHFAAPQAEGAFRLIVETQSSIGSDWVEQAIAVQRSYKLLLSTDKPIYQPGQIIHLRALAVSAFDRRPVTGTVELSVMDAKGNKVFQRAVEASAYGIAAADFQLAGEVATGDYKLTSRLGDTTSERTVAVQHYVLPKFKVSMSADRAWYLPGARVTGKLNAAYFFGKPVQSGAVALAGFVYDVERRQVLDITGRTNDVGVYEFAFDLPAEFVSAQASGQSEFLLQAAVTDEANHTEQAGLSLPIAQLPIVIQAVPEAGAFKPRLPNQVYIVTTYPDGSPAPSEVDIQSSDGQHFTAHTGDAGLAVITMTVEVDNIRLDLRATDAQGNIAQAAQEFYATQSPEYVLLRPDRAAYRVGESMTLDVFASGATGAGLPLSSTAYVDIIHEGQTVSTRAVDLTQGHGRVTVDLSDDLAGTLTIHAYKLLLTGEMVRDTRIALVDPANDLALSLTPDRDTYKPGDTAKVGVQVNAAAALGLAVVDESVFALQEQDPGFAKLYFLLEKELMAPKYELHGYTPARAFATGASRDELRADQDVAAKATLALGNARTFDSNASAAPRGLGGYSLVSTTRYDKASRAELASRQMLGSIANLSFGLLGVLPLAVLGLSVWSLRRERVLRRSAAITVAVVGVTAIVVAVKLAVRTLQGEPAFGYDLDNDLLGITNLLALVAIVLVAATFVTLAIYSVVAKDRFIGTMVILMAACVPLIGVGFAAGMSGWDEVEDAGLALVGLLSVLLVPLALLLRAIGFAVQRQRGAAVTTLGAGGFPLIVLILLLVILAGCAAGQSSPLARRIGLFDKGQNLAAPAAEAMAAPTAAAAESVPTVQEVPAASQNPDGASGAAQPAPRLRQFFPETLFWLPEVMTDETGKLSVDIPLADSITTWRLTAIANAQDGRMGSATAGLRVFQDFFIDLDLPVALTQNDEIAVPVAVYNYLPESQVVSLSLEPQAWFELKDERAKTLTIGAGDVSVAYYRIKAAQFGRHTLTVMARGTKLSDAIRKDVVVHPDGKQIEFAQSGNLDPVTQVSVPVPPDAIAGTVKLAVKIYPGVMSQIVEGLDAILRMPYGCFEQTSSTTYPNVLALDYMKTTGKATPEIQMKAESYINTGYQRLAGFEVSGGGFSLFGDAPADRMLTAYGLQEFHDMSRVSAVDPALIDRAAQWLLGQQDADGAWKNDRGIVHEDSWQKLGDDRLPVTAYIAWSLIDAGKGEDARVQQAVSFVATNAAKAEDPYVLALAANALVSAGVRDEGLLQRLAGAAQRENGLVSWPSNIATMMGSHGAQGSIETTALAVYALMRANAHSDLVNPALDFLTRNKDAYGTWNTTQATVLALKALLQSVRQKAEDAEGTVTVRLNDGPPQTLRVTPDNRDVVQLVTFSDVPAKADNTVQLSVEGKARMAYQVAGSYYVPWSGMAPELSQSQPVSILVSYNRTELRVNETIRVQVRVQMNVPGTAQQTLIDLGVPPGFDVLVDELEARIARDGAQSEPWDGLGPGYGEPVEGGGDGASGSTTARIKRYELAGRQLLVYVQNLSAGEPLVFQYQLRARFPLLVSVPATTAYDYYNPQTRGELAPLVVTVN